MNDDGGEVIILIIILIKPGGSLDVKCKVDALRGCCVS